MDDTKNCPYCDEVIKANAIKCKHCGSLLTSSDFFTGEVTSERQLKAALSDRFEILEEIGRGGMATVYKAIQKNLNRTVALKVIHKNLIGYKEFLERFHREAQLAASLNHHNIVTIYDEGASEGIHYIAMEYLDGTDLHRYIQQKGRLQIEEAVDIIAPIAEALNYAHVRGIIHRDIKSSNIIISENGKPVLTDFGIAFAASSSKLTQSGMVIGTPDYMSPEQAVGGEVDAQSDLYSLGIALYECLTGILPFRGDTPISTIYKIVNNDVEPIRKTVLDAPNWIEGVIKKILAKEKKNRFKTGNDFSNALRAKKAPTGSFQIGSEDETIKISNEQIDELKKKYHPIIEKKKRLLYLSSAAAIVILLFFLIFSFGIFSSNDKDRKGNNWDQLTDIEKKRVELLLEEGDQLFLNNKIILPPQKNAAELYSEALSISPQIPYVVSQLQKISNQVEENINKLIDQNNIDKAKEMLTEAEKYFSSNNLIYDTFPRKIKVKEYELQAAGILNKDPMAALEICSKIKELDPENTFAKSILPNIKKNITLLADAEYEKENYKQALDYYNNVKNVFGTDDHINQMIQKANLKIQHSSKIIVPNLIGMSIKNVNSLLSRNGLVLGTLSEIISSEKNKGKVINQIPKSGKMVSKGTQINLIVGK